MSKLGIRVYQRDGFKCVYCGFDGSVDYQMYKQLVVDHFFPVCLGGKDTLENLVTACSGCNSFKRGKQYESIEDFGVAMAVKDSELFDEYIKVKEGDTDAADMRSSGC